MTNPAGNGYRGTATKAASGRACMNWTEVDDYAITASLPFDDISEIENYCRRVPFTEWNGPSCVTVDEAGMTRLERCDVPYCGIVNFYPRDAMLARVFATATCLSVCLSVRLSGRLSVTRRYCA